MGSMSQSIRWVVGEGSEEEVGGGIGGLSGSQGYLDLLTQLPVVERVEELRGRRPGLRSGPLQPTALSGRWPGLLLHESGGVCVVSS